MMKRASMLIAALVVAVAAAPGMAQTKVFKNSTKGSPKVSSIQSLAFGPQGHLLIADGKGKQVFVVDTQDTKPTKWSSKKITDVRKQLAARLGTTAKGVSIDKIAVNPASHRVYFAIRNFSGGNVILTMDGDGKVRPFDLENVTYARIKLDGGKQDVTNITDLAWSDDRILVSAQAGRTFGSKIFSINVPVAHDAANGAHSAETYHVAHRRWETRAPIYTLIPYQEKGKQYLVGAFTCTPVVKFRIDDLTPGAKVKGDSIIEVGSGNRPRDMFVYEKGGKKYVLMSTYRFHHKRRPVGPSPYWVVKLDYNLLAETDAVNEKALVRVNRKYENVTKRAGVVQTYHGVMHMDKLDQGRAVVVRTTEDGRQDLEVIALP